MTADKKIAEAKKYMDRVIDMMALSHTQMEAIIKRNAKKMIDSSLYNANDPTLYQKLSDIVEETQRQLFNAIYINCYRADAIAHEKEEEKNTDKYLLMFLVLHVSGKTLEGRISMYASQFRNEIEAYIEIGIAKGMKPAQILNYYLTWLKNPFASPLIIEAVRKQGFKPVALFYKNKYKSAFNNLVRLHQDTTMRAYNYAINSIWQDNHDIIGWYTVRGSSYPCSICDDNVGVFHPKNEFFYGWHPRCCCIMLPVYRRELL